jgi:hypothetical protein
MTKVRDIVSAVVPFQKNYLLSFSFLILTSMMLIASTLTSGQAANPTAVLPTVSPTEPFFYCSDLQTF